MGQTATVNGSNDRVSFSFGMKLSLPAKYESADFHINYSSDVEETESLEGALARVKSVVTSEAYKLYNQIRDSETGLINGQQSSDKRDVPAPAKTEELPIVQAKVTDPKVLRQQIKSAFACLEAQKKITKADFVKNYLLNKKVDELELGEITVTLNMLRNNFKELGL